MSWRILVILLLVHDSFSQPKLPRRPEDAYQLKALTWNMHGATSGKGSGKVWKWGMLENELNAAGQQPYEVVTLQECGRGPDFPQAKVNPVKRVENLNGQRTEVEYVAQSGLLHKDDRGGPVLSVVESKTMLGGNPHYSSTFTNVRELEWQTKQQKYYVYHYALPMKDDIRQTNQKDQLNLAIVSLYRADEVLIFTDTDYANKTALEEKGKKELRNYMARPLLGIRIEDSFVFNMHAPPNRNNPAEAIINHAVQYILDVTDQGGHSSWIIMGDFNRPDLNKRLNFVHEYTLQTIQTGTPTQRSGGMLDYAVVGSTTEKGFEYRDGLMRAERVNGLGHPSDHTAVRFISRVPRT